VATYPNEHLGVNTISLDPMWRSPFGANIYMAASLPYLLGIASVVLLLTSANVSTLALVRFVSRRREIAIRQSLGAGRFELMRQMFLEGLLLSLFSGAVALLMTSWTAKIFSWFIPPNANPLAINGAIDRNVILLILFLAFMASLICGAFPAWRSSRLSSVDVLKDEAVSLSAGTQNRRLLSGLVVAQIALSLALLITSGLFLRTLRNLSASDPGFEREHVLTASMGLTYSGYSSQEIDAIKHKVLDRVLTQRGVRGAALTDWVPFNFNRKTVDTYPEGYAPQPHESLEVRRADVTAGYFATLNIPVIAGRDFTRDDNGTAPRVVIVDQTAANRYWPGKVPVGRRLEVWGRPFTVIGVVRNTKHQFITEATEPMIYLSYFQEPDSETTIQVRTQGNPELLAPLVEEAIHEVDRKLAVFDVRPLTETARMASLFVVVETTFASAFALLALALAATGIYGVVAYRTQMRTHEIGIRVALGAAKRDVLRLILFQGMYLTVLGLVIGLALALGLARSIGGLLYGVSFADPLTGIIVTLLLGSISLLACLLPAIHAMRINPVNAIRGQ